MKNIILFGAGASFGSDSTDVPPLTSSLFEKLISYNPLGWGALPHEFARIFNEDFERGMIKVAEEKPYDLPILQRALASFFFNYTPRTTNLYCKLAHELKDSNREVTLVSLNYERLLELSLNEAGIRLIMDDNPKQNEIEIIYPHGCCNLFCESVRGMAENINFHGINVQINGRIKPINELSEFTNRINKEAFPPVMSYFEPEKRTSSGQAFLNRQRARYDKLIQEAQTIIVIGVKLREHDKHIWDPIKKTKARFIYCSGSEEFIKYKEWSERTRTNKQNSFINGYWSDNFDIILNEFEN